MVKRFSALGLFLVIVVMLGFSANLAAQTPSLTVNPVALSFGEIAIGEESVQSYTLTGSDLTSSVFLHVSQAFLISLNEQTGFQRQIVIEPDNGEISATIYVKFLPLRPGIIQGRVRNRALGVPNQFVALHGIGIFDPDSSPQVATTPDSLYFGEVMLGEEVVLSYSLEASDLISNLAIHASRSYLVSLQEDDGFQNRLVIEPVNGEINETVYVKFLPFMPHEFSGRIRHRTAGFPQQFVRLYGIGVMDDEFPPELTLVPDSLYFGEVLIDEESILSYELNGQNLVTNINLRSPRGYLISFDADSGFQQVLNIEPDAGSVSQTIYVKFLPQQPRNYFGAVRHRTAGIGMLPLFVRGIGIEEERSTGEDSQNSPEVFMIDNYPNPFNPETYIGFNLTEDSFITLEVYNIKGQLVKTLADEYLRAGNHKILWQGRDEANRPVSSGVYFYRISNGSLIETKKMILMK
jgi:hypothetical protein